MAVAWHVSRLPLLPLASVKPLLAAPRLALLPSFSSCSTLSRPSLLSPPPPFLPSRPAIHFCSSFIRLLSGGGGQHRGRRLSSLNIRELYLFHSRCFRSSDSSPPSLRLALLARFLPNFPPPNFPSSSSSPYLPCPRLLNALPFAPCSFDSSSIKSK